MKVNYSKLFNILEEKGISKTQLKLYYYRGLKEFKNKPGYLVDTCLSAQDKYKELLNYFGVE